MTAKKPVPLPPIAALVLASRRKRGWTQAQLAARVDKSRGWVEHVERGRRTPRTIDLMIIAQALKIELPALARALRKAGREAA